jgi:hypothetical protein
MCKQKSQVVEIICDEIPPIDAILPIAEIPPTVVDDMPPPLCDDAQPRI